MKVAGLGRVLVLSLLVSTLASTPSASAEEVETDAHLVWGIDGGDEGRVEQGGGEQRLDSTLAYRVRNTTCRPGTTVQATIEVQMAPSNLTVNLSPSSSAFRIGGAHVAEGDEMRDGVEIGLRAGEDAPAGSHGVRLSAATAAVEPPACQPGIPQAEAEVDLPVRVVGSEDGPGRPLGEGSGGQGSGDRDVPLSGAVVILAGAVAFALRDRGDDPT